MYSDEKIILTANKCYKDLNRNFKEVLYNTLTFMYIDILSVKTQFMHTMYIYLTTTCFGPS